MPPSPSHGRLHPDDLSRTHTDSDGWWNPTEVSFNSFFYNSALGQNLPSCAPLFLFIQEVSQTGANHSTSLSLNDPAYLYFSLCICFEILPHISEFISFFYFLYYLGVKKRPVGVWMKGCGCIFLYSFKACGFLVNF